ncbi:MAG: zinc-dependent alcohol dehydrogenase family protein [candidate division KSB1 bacterium]|nr:zinc-dependent alcohol dehydrogenase family protein [candidate division KSB1 bacterium]MDZ7313926.1 zinc-dependent alcohol dehydrogenase family protein [candidate division KSB1 bacterium]
MNVAVFYAPKRIEIEERPTPKVGPHEVLVQIGACGICGTDLHIFAGEAHARPPVILGHEFAGTVVEVGKEVRDLHLGDKVAVDPNIACGGCYYCHRGQVNFCENLRALGVDIDGGFAEFCLAPAKQCYKLPADFPLEFGAFAEPLSCCIRGLERSAIQPGQSVAIVGAGNIGLLMLQLARLAGAGAIFVLDPLESKRAIARQLQVDLALDSRHPEAVKEIAERTHGGCDVVIECAGNAEAAELAFALTKRGSRVVLFGLAPPEAYARLYLQAAFLKELTIVSSILNPFTFHTAVALLMRGKIDLTPFSINRFGIAEIAKALDSTRQGLAIKTLVIPNGSAGALRA